MLEIDEFRSIEEKGIDAPRVGFAQIVTVTVEVRITRDDEQ